MQLRDALVLAAVLAVGLVSLVIVFIHATYLGFNLSYAYPVILVGIAVTIFAYCLRKTLFGSSGVFRDKGVLLLIVAIGLALRIFMMFNPNATPDEWNFFFVVGANNPLSSSFIQNYSLSAGVISGDTTPLVLTVLKAGYLLSPTLAGVRLFPVLMNTSLIPISYYLAKEFSNEDVALFTAFLFAINPGALYFFDLADSDVFLFFFGMIGLLFFIRGYRAESLRQLILSGFFFGLAYWSKTTLPLTWIGVAVLFALAFIHGAGKARKLVSVLMVTGIAIGVFLPWWVASPSLFDRSIVSLPLNAFHQLLNLGNLNLGGSGTVITRTASTSTSTSALSTSALSTSALSTSTISTSTISASTPASSGLQAIVNLLTLWNVLPRVAGANGFSSFVDVVAQLPIWFGPMVFLIGIPFLIYKNLKKHGRRVHLVLLLWILGSLIMLLTIPRDVRYFIDIATFPVLFLNAEAIYSHKTPLVRALRVSVVLFAVIFLVVGATIGFELYDGVSQSSQFVNHNYPDGRIMVNYGAYASLLSPSENVEIIPNNATLLNATLSAARYDAVVVWQQSRTINATSQMIEIISSHFAHEITFGLSDFSYVSVYYDYVQPN